MACLRLATERVAVDRSTGLQPEYQEMDLPVIQLVVPGGDPDQETRARYLIESFGAVELDACDHVVALPGSRAQYLVHPDGDADAYCSFSAWALPQLAALGWRIEVAADYPYKVVTGAAPWYAQVEPDGEATDWFSLELGVELDGQRINLLPALLALIDGAAGARSIEALLRKPRRFLAVPLGDGRWLPVPPERLRILLGVLADLYAADGVRARFAAAHAAQLAALDAAFAGAGERLRWGGAVEPIERGRALIAEPAAPVAPPAGLRAELRPYQQDGLRWLQHLRACGAGGILADDMGLGKTLQTIAHIVAEKESGRLDAPALVVAPTSLLGNWRRELRRFAPALRVLALHGPGRRPLLPAIPQYDVVVTSYPLLLRDIDDLAGHRFHLAILDEAQTIKNPRSQAHRAALRLDAAHRLCLTGTPLENHLEELWALFAFLGPGLLGDIEVFRRRYRTPIERPVAGAAGARARLEDLRRLVGPYILRRMKDEVARDLPPKTEIIRPVELDGEQRELYESIRIAAHSRVRSAIRDKGMAASTFTILDALMKLRQACCDPRLVAVQAARQVTRSAKLELLRELVARQREQGRRVLIFSQFTSMLALIGQMLTEEKIAYVALTGSTTDRQKPVDAFQGGRADVFLISLKAGGTGLNLTAADTVIHYDPWWNPAAQAQATDRAYRIGQTRPVFVYNLIAAGSVEERMLALQQHKRRLAESILDSRGALAFTTGDLDDLFAPLPES
ncbi:MAG TPA: DEAD/DEAH box helicase [Kofleriaceae bacterium]|nr:DEAD/DEAH box helicase [Kofleriaceae bacterium]